MEKKLNILIVGLGSVGQRHVRNLKEIYGSCVHLFAFRQRRRMEVYDENLNVVEGKNIEDEYHIKVFDDFEEAMKQNIDIAVISNPTSMHVEYATIAAQNGCHLFIEKPISDCLENALLLCQTVQESKVIAGVGYQMRYHPCIKLLKEYVENSVIGQLLYVRCEVGELLTDMHRYEHYTEQYIAKKGLGGGVVANQIHELDYLQWILGMPKEIYSVGGKLSDFDIDVEDCALSICKFEHNGVLLPVYIQQDMLQKPPIRNCCMVGNLGKVEVDLLLNSVKVFLHSGKKIEKNFGDLKRNEMFKEELKAFIECVDNNIQPAVTLEEGIKSLRIASSIKESMRKKAIVKNI